VSRAARIRHGDAGDLPFLWEMLHEAAFWNPERSAPGPDATRTDPHLARYLEGWGRPSDAAVIALDDEDRPIGAAWYRLFDAAMPGYGFVDERTPEVSIGVARGRRGQGVGTVLLESLIARARDAGFGTLSLSVEVANPARRLYERLGFVRVGGTDDAWTMRRSLS
jgi:GNAT superfamily N-acetyltransferase